MLNLSFQPEPWMEDAKCYNDEALAQWQRENREDQFFDDTYETRGRVVEAKHRRERAKAYCLDCPVRSECLAFALRENIQYGIYAGTTARERRMIQRKARKSVLEFLARQQVQLPDGSDPIAS